MNKLIELVPFTKILCEYRILEGLTLRIEDCSALAKEYQDLEVTGYQLFDYSGTGYFTRYLDYSVRQLPTLTYRKRYMIPMLFRADQSSQKFVAAPYRWIAFFQLLDWYLENEPEKVLLQEVKVKGRVKVIDTAFIVFRLTEIFDAAGRPMSHFYHMADFIQWNSVHRLIDDKSETGFDPTDKKQLSLLNVITEIVNLKYRTAI